MGFVGTRRISSTLDHMTSFCSPLMEELVFACSPVLSVLSVAGLSYRASMGDRLPERERERTFIGGVRCRNVVVWRSFWRPNWVITLSSTRSRAILALIALTS